MFYLKRDWEKPLRPLYKDEKVCEQRSNQNGKRAALQTIIKVKLATKRKAVEESPGPSTSSSSSSSPSTIERKLRAEVARLRKENAILNDLNRRLQEQVINHFSAGE